MKTATKILAGIGILTAAGVLMSRPPRSHVLRGLRGPLGGPRGMGHRGR